MSKTQELVKIIQENPNLPLVFMMSNDEVAGDYGCIVMEDFSAYKSEIYKYERWGDLVFSDDKDEVIEHYIDKFAEDKKYKDLVEEKYTEAIEDYVENNVEHYEAIVVYVK